MRTNRCRPFTLLDGMILVGAIAFGVAYIRNLVQDSNPTLDWLSYLVVLFVQPSEGWTIEEILYNLLELWCLAAPSFMACTVALLALRLRRPRVPWRRLSRQPGTLAALWAVLSFLAAVPVCAGLVWARPFGHGGAFLLNLSVWPATGWVILFIGPALAGLSISIAWMTLAMMRSWRPERGWLDRLGRLLGLFYIVNGPIGLALFYWATMT